jgi:hypothetical protein
VAADTSRASRTWSWRFTAVGQVEVRQVHLVDGGDGSALPRYVASHPAAIAEVFRALASTTGIDLTKLLAREITPPAAPPLPGVRP